MENEKKNEEVETTALVKVAETDKSFAIEGKIDNWEDFFCEDKNFVPIVKFVEKRVKGLVADATTEDGQIARKTLAKKINALVKEIDNAHDAVVKELKAKPNLVDKVRKHVKDSLIYYKEEVLAPIKDIEARKAEIVEIENLPAQGVGCDSAGIKMLLERLLVMAKKPEYWKESAKDAESAVIESKRQLTDMLASAEKAEAEKRELEELRRQKEELERAEREKREAELKKAQEEAARLAKEKEEAEKKAREAERAAQEAREREEAARNSKEAMERAAIGAQQAVPMSKTLPQPKPSKWTDEQKAVNKRIAADIADTIEPELKKRIAGHSDPGYRLAAEESAKAIVKAILTGKINNLKVEY